MTTYVSPCTRRRHAGRAIRKARREQADRVAPLSSTDWTVLMDGLVAALHVFGTAATQTLDAFATFARDAFTKFGCSLHEALIAPAEQERRAHRDWMLTYRGIEPLAREEK